MPIRNAALVPSPTTGHGLVEVLRGDSLRGCGRAVDGDRQYFLRWHATTGIEHPPGATELPPEREYRILSHLTSAHVPTAIDLRRDEAAVTSITEWIDGAHPVQLEVESLRHVADQLLDVLRRAHRAGWVHGDIKPGNVLLAKHGPAFLLDWAAGTRIGLPAPPGTLGYVRWSNWTGIHLASPSDDIYSLAVTIWELLHGTPAFSGSRERVLTCQRSFAFPYEGSVPESIARLFDCAHRGGDGLDFDSQVQNSISLNDLRMSVVELNTAAVACGRATQQIAAAIQGRPSGVFRVTLELPEADADIAAQAIIRSLRSDYQRNALSWGEVRHVPRMIGSGDPEMLASRIDSLRNTGVDAMEDFVEAFSNRRHPVLVASDAGIPSCERLVWQQLLQGNREPPYVFEGWIVVVIASGGEPRVGVARDLLEAACASTSFDEETASALRSGPLRCIRDASGALSHALASGQVVYARGAYSVSGVLGLPFDTESVRDSSECPRISEILSCGEIAAASGDLSMSIRACIRATTLAATTNLIAADITRLADLWQECGRSDVATILIERDLTTLQSVPGIIRVARAAASNGDTLGLMYSLRVLEKHTDRGHCAEEYLRLRAISSLIAGDTAIAYGLLREALATSRTMNGCSPLWILVTLGNCLRLMSRLHSARRALRYVRDRAIAAGSVRLELAASSNLIIARAGDVVCSQLASDAVAIARRCHGWGMISEALVNALTAATYLVAAHDYGRAAAIAREFTSDSAAFGRRDTTTYRNLLSLMLVAVDLDDAVDYSLVEAYMSSDRGDSAPLHWLTLRDEIGIYAFQPTGAKAGRDARATSLLLRVLTRNRVTNLRRVARCFHALADAIDHWLPLVGHCCRIVVKACADDAARETLLTAARLDRHNVPVAVALHASALAWTVNVSAESRNWYYEHASGDATRAPGLRKWEWELALLRSDPLSDELKERHARLEGVLVAAEAFASRLWQAARLFYLSSLPDAVLFDVVNCNAPKASTKMRANLDGVRADLYRAMVSDPRSASGDAGLRRVLRSALAIRSTASVDDLLGGIALGVASVCRAERAVVVYRGEGTTLARIAVNGEVAAIAADGAEISSTAVARVDATGHACLIDDACGDDILGDRPSVIQFRPRSLVIAPLRTPTRSLGFIYVESRSSSRCFRESDVELVEGFAAQAALALENAMLVSDLRRSCEELERARSDAVRAESLRGIGRMASEIAHDFNNLLTAILGEAQLICQSTQAGEIAQSIDVIQHAALDGAQIIRRMQDSVRGHGPDRTSLIAMCDVVKSVVDMMRWRANQAGVILVGTASTPAHVRGVASELREVLTNLIANALDATPAGGQVSISEVGGASDRLVLEVSDTGCGMDEITMSRIFEPFFSTKCDRGNGLGLSIARGIAQKHGGEISFASTPGEGTTARLTLPLAVHNPRQLPWAEKTPRAESEAEKPRVLIIGRSPASSHALAGLLRSAGADVEIAVGELEGRRRLDEVSKTFDAVVADAQMPNGVGLDAAKQIRAAGSRTRVVLMSDVLSEPEQEAALALGADILRKPFTAHDITCLIDRIS
jgi:signal transduction histidine kinase/CheY-like chemotaxis protein